MGAEPGERFSARRAQLPRVGVIPGSDRQLRLPAGVAQHRVVPQLPRQEHVVPAAEQADGDVHVGHAAAVVAPLPVRPIGRRVAQQVLEERHGRTRGQRVKLGKRPSRRSGAPGPADGHDARGQAADRPLDAGGQVAPGEGGLESERAAYVGGVVEL